MTYESDNPQFDHLINNMDSDEVVPPLGAAPIPPSTHEPEGDVVTKPYIVVCAERQGSPRLRRWQGSPSRGRACGKRRGRLADRDSSPWDCGPHTVRRSS